MSYYYWKSEISKSNCEKIIKEFDESTHKINQGSHSLYPEEIEFLEKMGIQDQIPQHRKNTSSHIRRTSLNWLSEDHLYNKILFDYVKKANKIMFNYNLDKFTPCQFAQYNVGDFYEYHQDSGHQYVESHETRKLSMTVQLSDPKDYEDGEFQFYNGIDGPDIPDIQEQGSILVFDSRMWHRVTPITKGVRYSLVSWILGPAFV